MKKFLALFLILIMSFSFVSCGESENVGENDLETSKTHSIDDGDKNNVSSDEITVEMLKKASETNPDDFSTEAVENGVAITSYNGEDKIIIIPDEIDGKKVVEIGSYAFGTNTEIKGVKISDTVEVISEGAFINCYDLEVFVSGKALVEIGNSVFGFCRSLHTIELNEGLKILGSASFLNTESLKKLEIPSSVDSVVHPFGTYVSIVTLVVDAGSVMETYAKENNIKYEIR